MVRTTRQIAVLAGLLALIPATTGAGNIFAAKKETPVPPREHAEQYTFDPKAKQWLSTPPPAPGTEDGDLDLARQWLARGESKTALKIIQQWKKSYPTSPRYAEALYLEGTANVAGEDYYSAHKAYQELLNNYPGSPYAEDTLSGDFRIAEQYLAGKRRKAWGGLIRIRDREGGIEILNDLITNYPDTPLAPWAQISKADYYYARGEFELAEDEYATFAREYPKDHRHSYALYQAAQSALAGFPGIKFDEAALIEARERFTQFMMLFPDLARQKDVPILLEQIDSKRADKSVDIAQFYERTKRPKAAKYYYRKAARQWPGTPAAAKAAKRLAEFGEPLETAEP